MAKIRIEWLSDSCSCETCGSSYAEGARVFIDDKPEIELLPSAHCFGGDNYGDNDVYASILEKLGHTVDDERRSPPGE